MELYDFLAQNLSFLLLLSYLVLVIRIDPWLKHLKTSEPALQTINNKSIF